MTQKIEKTIIISTITPNAILTIAHWLPLVVLQCYNKISIAINDPIAIKDHLFCYNLDLT